MAELYATKRSELRGVKRALLREVSRFEVILKQYDAWLDSNGPLDGDGAPKSFMASYIALLNGSVRAHQAFSSALGVSAQTKQRDDVLAELSKYRGGTAS